MILFIFILFTAIATPTCYPSSGHTKSSICTQTCPHMHTLMSPGMIKNDIYMIYFFMIGTIVNPLNVGLLVLGYIGGLVSSLSVIYCCYCVAESRKPKKEPFEQ